MNLKLEKRKGDILQAERMAVFGAGSWGSALSTLLANKGHHVWLWVRREEHAKRLRKERENKKYLPDVMLPENLDITSNLETAASNSDIWVFVVPSHVMRTLVEKIKPYLNNNLIVSATKGFEVDTYRTMTRLIADELFEGDNRNVYALSGPNHAEEVGQKVPTATVIAGRVKRHAERLQKAFMTSFFRVYTNPDLKGVEFGGALKNIVALGSGIADGLGYGDNAKAALLTRGVAEIARLGTAYGARPLTFTGLSGVGDLVVTCTSTHSRNQRAGRMLGEGKSLSQILSEMNMVVEGIKTTEAAYQMSEDKGIEMPITREIYQVLFEEKEPDEAVRALMERARKNEMEEFVENDELWLE